MMRDKIAKWYAQGLWSASMVHDALLHGVISDKEYRDIVGDEQK